MMQIIVCTYKFFKELMKKILYREIQLKGRGKSWEDKVKTLYAHRGRGRQKRAMKDSKYLHQLKYIPPNWPSVQ